MNPKIPYLMNSPAGLRGFLQRWLCCAAFYYPFFWISVFLVQAAPALIRVPLLGLHLEYFEISYGGTFARSVPRSALDFQHAHPLSHGGPMLGTLIAIVLIIGLLTAFLGRNHRLLCGFFIAVLGESALLHSLPLRLALGSHSPLRLVSAVLFFAMTCFRDVLDAPRIESARIPQAMD